MQSGETHSQLEPYVGRVTTDSVLRNNQPSENNICRYTQKSSIERDADKTISPTITAPSIVSTRSSTKINSVPGKTRLGTATLHALTSKPVADIISPHSYCYRLPTLQGSVRCVELGLRTVPSMVFTLLEAAFHAFDFVAHPAAADVSLKGRPCGDKREHLLAPLQRH